MNLTKSKLKQIIKEELQKLLKEVAPGSSPAELIGQMDLGGYKPGGTVTTGGRKEAGPRGWGDTPQSEEAEGQGILTPQCTRSLPEAQRRWARTNSDHIARLIRRSQTWQDYAAILDAIGGLRTLFQHNRAANQLGCVDALNNLHDQIRIFKIAAQQRAGVEVSKEDLEWLFRQRQTKTGTKEEDWATKLKRSIERAFYQDRPQPTQRPKFPIFVTHLLKKYNIMVILITCKILLI